MLTRLHVRNFKVFEDVEIELGDSVVFVGPNNSGKTSALQALALWEAGIRRWQERRNGSSSRQRTGAALNRLDLVAAIPLPNARMLWRAAAPDARRREEGQRNGSANIEIEVAGIDGVSPWACGMEFHYANEESFYCRPLARDGASADVPDAAQAVRVAYLPPMSGLTANEVRIDPGAVNVRLGEGRTAETLRNICYLIYERNPNDWDDIRAAVRQMFGVELEAPQYLAERGEILMAYRERGVRLDLLASGRGLLQTLLLLAHMYTHRGAVLLLDEPDAHLEVIRQREVYRMLQERAESTGTQLLVATHSEVLLNEAVERDVVVSFVGRPHRIEDKVAQTLKALRDIPAQDYYQAEQSGWALYLEGSTDLDVLRSFAVALGHDAAAAALKLPFVHPIYNQFSRAQSHFHGLREAASNLRGFALLDRQERPPDSDPRLGLHLWKRCEIENYLCQRETLEAFAAAEDERLGPPSAPAGAPRRVDVMKENIERLEASLANLGRPSPWGPDLKVSDDFLSPLFKNYYTALGLPNVMEKKNFHVLARHVRREDVDQEVVDVLDQIAAVAEAAQPGGLA